MLYMTQKRKRSDKQFKIAAALVVLGALRERVAGSRIWRPIKTDSFWRISLMKKAGFLAKYVRFNMSSSAVSIGLSELNILLLALRYCFYRCCI